MLNRLLGIKSLDATEPVVLEEVDDSMAPQMPAEYQKHLEETDFDYEADPDTVWDPDGEEEVTDEDGVDYYGNA